MCEKIRARDARGRRFSIVVVAEGATARWREWAIIGASLPGQEQRARRRRGATSPATSSASPARRPGRWCSATCSAAARPPGTTACWPLASAARRSGDRGQEVGPHGCPSVAASGHHSDRRSADGTEARGARTRCRANGPRCGDQLRRLTGTRVERFPGVASRHLTGTQSSFPGDNVLAAAPVQRHDAQGKSREPRAWPSWHASCTDL